MQLKQTIHRIRYFITDAWDEGRHSPGANLLALATLTAVLFLAGLAMLLVANLETRVSQLREDMHVEVYLFDDVSDADLARLREDLEAQPGVAEVRHVDKTEALGRFREFAADMAVLIDELETNPLPASYDVFLIPGPDTQEQADEIVSAFGSRPGVESARFDRELLRGLEALLGRAKYGGVALVTLVLTVVVFIMASVLRLAVHARRDEIDIMLLVGATPGFVRGPFLVAALCQGLIASVVALLIVMGVRSSALAYAELRSAVVLDLIARPLPLGHAAALIGVGLAVSLTGAYFAVRRPA